MNERGPERISAIGRLQEEFNRAADTSIIGHVTSVSDEMPFTAGDSEIVRSQPIPVTHSKELVDIDAERAAVLQQILAEEAGSLPVTPTNSEGFHFQMTISGDATAAALLAAGRLPLGGMQALSEPSASPNMVETDYAGEAADYADEFDEFFVKPPRQQHESRLHISRNNAHRLRVVGAWATAISLLAFSGTHIKELGAAFYQAGYERKPDLPKMWAAYQGKNPNAKSTKPASDATKPTNLPSMEPSAKPTTGAKP